ncbi:MAG: PHB depolymerase family esterase [Bacteroidota bacterium]
MKRFLIILSLSYGCLFSFAQQTINGSIIHDGTSRSFILYVPASYTGNQSVPLVMNFHGYTSNANEQMFYGDFRPIADTAGFLVVHPQGTLFNGNTHWNVGGWTVGSTVDDVDFVNNLLDSLANDYNIDSKRIYSTGMSNGGYMSFLLACQLSDRIAAVASVTGSMTPQTYDACDPQHPTPVMQIHGTTDAVVPYNGAIWTRSISDVIQYWTDYNNCDNSPLSSSLPNANPSDGSTVEVFQYDNGDRESKVIHYQVDNGGHTWPGTPFNGNGNTNQDFQASEVIWAFFLRYDLDGLNGLATSGPLEELPTIHLYPNPSGELLRLKKTFSEAKNYEILNLNGQRILTAELAAGTQEINLTNLPEGMFLLSIDGQTFRFVKK